MLASHVALCDDEGVLKDPSVAERFDRLNSSGAVDHIDKKASKKEAKRQRKERKRQEKEMRRLEKKRSKLGESQDEPRQVEQGESAYVRALQSYKSKAKGTTLDCLLSFLHSNRRRIGQTDHLAFKKGALIHVTDLNEGEDLMFGTLINTKKKTKPAKVRSSHLMFVFHTTDPDPDLEWLVSRLLHCCH